MFRQDSQSQQHRRESRLSNYFRFPVNIGTFLFIYFLSVYILNSPGVLTGRIYILLAMFLFGLLSGNHLQFVAVQASQQKAVRESLGP